MADYGIDVSGFNTIASWPAVQAVPNTWAWCKATQGGGYTNPRFASQFTGASGAGLAAGAYHFPDPNVSVAANVGHFVAIAGAVGALAKGAFVPLLDIENDTVDGITWTAAAANAFIPAFRDQLRAATGQRKLCVYASQSWFSSGFLRPDDWADQDVFLCAARYGFSPGAVGWSHPRLAVHQYTNGTPQFGSTLYSTDRSVLVGGFTREQLTIGGGVSPAATTSGDVMFEFVANGDTVQDNTKPVTRDNGLKQVVLLLGGGKVLPATWGDVCAKDKSFGGDGTGSVLGVAGSAYQSYLDTDTAARAAEKAVAALTPTAIAQAIVGALPASAGGAAPTYDIAIQPGDVVIAKAYPEKS